MIDMKSTMMKIKSCVFLLAVAGAWTLQAVEFTVNQMPVSPFADTEVSTNMVINKADINYVDLNAEHRLTTLRWLSEPT